MDGDPKDPAQPAPKAKRPPRHLLALRVSDNEHENYRQKAKAAGMKMSAWIRAKLST